MLRCYDPNEGNISINLRIDEEGPRELSPTLTDIKDIHPYDYRSFVGYVPQESQLFEGTIADNIAYGLRVVKDKESNKNFTDICPTVTMEDIIEAAKLANAHEFIVSVLPNGYDTLTGAAGSILSGGQKQRIAIARALCRKGTRLLIFDEPTAQLDPDSTQSITLMMESLPKLSNRSLSVIVVTHQIASLANADKIIVLKEGSVAQIGKHEELLKDSKSTYHRFSKNVSF